MKDISATEIEERLRNYSGPLPGDSLAEEIINCIYDQVKHLESENKGYTPAIECPALGLGADSVRFPEGSGTTLPGMFF